MDPARNQFITDAKDIVDRLYADLQQLRSLRAQGRHRRELASRIFRHVHTLKGSAGSVGLKSISQLTHEFESVLDAVRLGRVAIDDRLLNLFEDTADAIADALANSDARDDAGSQALDCSLAFDLGSHFASGVNRRQFALGPAGRCFALAQRI